MTTPTQPGERVNAFEGLKFPTYFRPEKPPAEGLPWLIDCPLAGETRARFVTDAANDYFTRTSDPGDLTILPAVAFCRALLHDGKATLVLRCPPRTAVGAILDVLVEVKDPSRSEPFRHALKLRVTDARPRKETEKRDPPPKAGALALPKIVEVNKDGWVAEDFGPESGLCMQLDVDGGLLAKVNVAN